MQITYYQEAKWPLPLEPPRGFEAGTPGVRGQQGLLFPSDILRAKIKTLWSRL